MKIKIGSLVKINIRLYFSKEKRVEPGDYAIVLAYPDSASTKGFDYLVDCNGIHLFVFKNELQLVT